jgi:hypothetical protein
MKALYPYLATVTLATAQVYTPPKQDSAPANNTKPTETISSGQDDEKKPAASPFGNELPFADPSAETITWNGHTWGASDNRLLAARFERYLNEPEEDDAAAVEYRKTIDEILELISPHHKDGPDFSGAVRLLPRASSYPGDAKLCDSLSQAIYVVVLAKKDIQSTKQISDSMDEEKTRLIRDADWKAANDKAPKTTEAPVKTNSDKSGKNEAKNANPVENAGYGASSLAYTNSVKRIAEIEGLRKAYAAKTELQIVQAKLQYQTLIFQLFLQRRFQHVLMACRFYNQIFRDGDQALKLDNKSDFSKLFKDSVGASPTVGSLDSLASEAIHDVDQGVKSFLYLLEKGELQSASKRLSEAYVEGEFIPSIKTLPRDQKRRVLAFTREANKLIGAIDVKDFATAKESVAALKGMAADFDATKAETAIASYTRVSDMAILAAKAAAAGGDTTEAGKQIQKAMEAWPQNPKLAEFDRLVESKSTLVTARNDFDRLLSEQNYREIQRRQYEIAPAIAGDPRREDAFKQIITNLVKIETALGKASEFSKAGQSYAAWEQLATLRADFPDDPKLGREMELLAPNVADFTKAITTAQELEKRSDAQTGSALVWYLKARSIYPRSEMADAGINRLIGKILQE